MDIYNKIIRDTTELLEPYTPKELSVNREFSWEMCEKKELILAKEAAYEMGGNRLAAVNYSSVTSSRDLVGEDQILLYGKDLKEIKDNVPFARIVLLNINDLDVEVAYKAIKELEYIKYNIIPKGYMIRTASFDNREQVRVSKEAIEKGIDFERIGSLYIRELKKNSLVNSVRIIFITEDIPEFKTLIELAAKTDSITKALDHVLSKIVMDCRSCDLRTVCNEVEGLRQLHFKKNKKGQSVN